MTEPASLEQRVAALEDTLGQLVHFIDSSQRPSLSTSPLSAEPDLQGMDFDGMRRELQRQADEAKGIKDAHDSKLRDA